MRLLITLCVALAAAAAAKAADRPNILWITLEDISPNLGCYGDDYAVTPVMDAFAKQAVRYTNAFAPIGVCAPARSCLLTGMYPTALGSQHMRCRANIPDFVRGYPEYLRKAGYYCTNNSKEDYNFNKPKGTWDESSRKAHYKKRPDGKPFFAVFNYTSCHESQIRLPEKRYQQRVKDFSKNEKHDPAEANVPPYHPNTPEVRNDWARYADMITYTDKQIGKRLKELEDAGLADDTIVFIYSDHGAGMPRSKRWLYDSSMKVPLLVRFPKKYQHLAPSGPGTATGRLVSFVDFGPTALSLAGVPVPKHMHGKPFLGKQAAEPRDYIYGYRGRMDERIDMIRCVRDKRFKYIRNYMPHLPYFHHQYISYMYEMPTMKVWQRLADAGKLAGPQAVFMKLSKPTEELYDTQADPHEVKNLAADPQHRATLKKLRVEHRAWMKRVGDLGLMPEADLRSRFGKTAPYDAVRQNPKAYPFGRIAAAADLAAARDAASLPRLIELLKADDPAVRYWAATGVGALGEAAAARADALKPLLGDEKGFVAVAAADALCRLGRTDEALGTLTRAMKDANVWARVQAINVLDRLDGDAAPAAGVIRDAVRDKANRGYVARVAGHAVRGLPE